MKNLVRVTFTSFIEGVMGYALTAELAREEIEYFKNGKPKKLSKKQREKSRLRSTDYRTKNKEHVTWYQKKYHKNAPKKQKDNRREALIPKRNKQDE